MCDIAISYRYTEDEGLFCNLLFFFLFSCCRFSPGPWQPRPDQSDCHWDLTTPGPWQPRPGQSDCHWDSLTTPGPWQSHPDQSDCHWDSLTTPGPTLATTSRSE